MKLVEFTVTSPTPHTSQAEFTAAYFSMFSFEDYEYLCNRLQSEGKILYKSWSLDDPSTFKGVYLFSDQAAVNEYWADPVNDNPTYEAAMDAAGFALAVQTSTV